MSYQVKIVTFEGLDVPLLTIPDGEHIAEILGDELERACQKAYARGRRDEAERLERKILDVLAVAGSERREQTHAL